MSTFTGKQQTAHREAFIEECHQNAWGARCNADFISKGLDDGMAEYAKLKAEDDQLAADIKDLEDATDHHTVDNRQKRRALQGRRDDLMKVQNALAENIRQGQQAVQNLLRSVENNLALAKYAEAWEWKEADAADSGGVGDNMVSE
jgi:hypothetical protein